MHTWKEFVDSLDSPGSHILIALLLIGVSVAMLKLGVIEEGKSLFVGMVSILGYAMRGTNKANGQPKPPSN